MGGGQKSVGSPPLNQVLAAHLTRPVLRPNLLDPMVSTLPAPATIDDLLHTEGKAELIGGRIVRFMPVGHTPSTVAFRIVLSLHSYAERVGRGVAYTDGMGFTVPELSSGRESFSPDASYYVGPMPRDRMRFIEAPPTFAAEVRSENDYGPAAERAQAEKRRDYFEAGTRLVWDVDPVAETVHAHAADAPDRPRVFRRGDTADAGDVLPGWRLEVNALFA